jgi:hypothetical protein
MFARRRGTAHDTRRRVPTGNRRLYLSSSKIHRVHALNVGSCHDLLDTAVACALAAETVQRLYCAYEELAGNTFATVERRYGISWTWRRANQTAAS